MSKTPTQKTGQKTGQKTTSTQKKLRQARREAGLTQGMAARISGLNRNTISRYESTERKFKDSIIDRLAEIYDENPGWLLEREGMNIKSKRTTKLQDNRPNQTRPHNIQIHDTPAARILIEIQDGLTKADASLIARYIQFVRMMQPPMHRRMKRPTVKVRLNNVSATLSQVEANLSDENIRRIKRFIDFSTGREADRHRPKRPPREQNEAHTDAHPNPNAHSNGSSGSTGNNRGHDNSPKG